MQRGRHCRDAELWLHQWGENIEEYFPTSVAAHTQVLECIRTTNLRSCGTLVALIWLSSLLLQLKDDALALVANAV